MPETERGGLGFKRSKFISNHALGFVVKDLISCNIDLLLGINNEG